MKESTSSDLRKIVRALAFAAHKHRNQRRKDEDALPYINHPISLADILVNEGGITDVDVICGAILHDTVEDTDTTPEELEREFGPVIRDIVMDVTDKKSLPKQVRKLLQIMHAPKLTEKPALVKIADKISNLRDIADHPPPDWPLRRRQEYFDWAKAVIDGIRDVPPRLRTVFDAAYARRPE